MLTNRLSGHDSTVTPMIRYHRWFVLAVLTLAVAMLPATSRAQTTQSSPPPTPTPTPRSLAALADETVELQKLRRDITARLADASPLDEVDASLDDVASTLLPLLQAQTAGLQADSRLSDLLDVDTSARRLDEQLTQAAGDLASEVRRAEKDLQELAELEARWLQLAAAAVDDDAPTLLLDRVREAQRMVDGLEGSVRVRRDRALELLDQSLASKTTVADVREALSHEIGRLQRETLAAASQPLWRIGLQRPRAAAEILRRTAGGDLFRILEYTVTAGGRIGLVFPIALAAGLTVSLLVRRRIRHQATADEPLELSPVLAHPLSASLLVALAATRLLAPPGPQIVDHLFWALMALPAAHLTSTILGPASRLPIALITATVLLWPLRAYVEAIPVLDRLLLLTEDVAGIVAVTLILGRGLILDRLGGGWRAAVRALLWIQIAVLAVSLASGIIGEVGLARLLRDGAVVSLGLAMVLYGIARALLRIVTDVLRGPIGGRLKMLHSHSAAVLRTVRGTVIAGAIAAWAWLSLQAFQLARPLQAGVKTVLAAGIEVGWFALTIGEVLSFVAVVAGAFLAARIVCFVLDEEFLPRLPLARGVPYMISTSVRYLILLAGFALALAALGVDLSKATILAGAFGVGLGFGLQNVVNNFVSGLILLFERPIRVGDVVEVSGVLGQVSRIGIRSSTVSTFVGSEVLVPNGDLISKDVTNWTLSSQRRLVEVLVGVAYGSDPRTVIEVLERVAGHHPDVVDDPAPKAFMVSFGDSQLDFRLVSWVARYGDGYRVASELRVAVAEAFAEAGIEIPFPQQELRVRAASVPLPLVELRSQDPGDSD
jgi:small-conductance mechanosensitive channel